MTRIWLVGFWLLLCVGSAACNSPTGSGADADEEPDPGPGPHFTVSPLELDKIARITPLGTNGKVLPLGHTYWYTCDTEWILPSERACLRERLAIRAPGDGVVWALDASPNGEVVIQGPPGLYATLSHVTPVPGLARGDAVEAGDTIAHMYHDHAFDFGLVNYGIDEHRFLNQARFANSPAYLHSQSPVAVFAEPLRSQLIARVATRADPLGTIVFDEAGTAAGNWFLEGIPFDASFTPAWAHAQMFLGPLQERADIRIISSEAGWFAALLDIVVVDPDYPRWEDITPASGPVWIPVWEIGRDAGPNHDEPRGSVLVQVLPAERLRIEHFDTHAPVAEFTAAASVYER